MHSKYVKISLGYFAVGYQLDSRKLDRKVVSSFDDQKDFYITYKT